MRPKARRALRALAAGGLGAMILAAAVWANLLAGVGGDFLGRSTELTPTLPVSAGWLALQSAGLALVLVAPLALMAAFSGPWPFRLLSALMLTLGFYWLGETMSQQFTADSGMTWLPGEAFDTLFWRPGLTPALWGLAVLAYLRVLARLNRAPQLSAPDPRAPQPAPQPAPRKGASPQDRPQDRLRG